MLEDCKKNQNIVLIKKSPFQTMDFGKACDAYLQWDQLCGYGGFGVL